MSHSFEKGSFDFIASIATLHHLPLAPALDRFKQLLRPGGALVVIGLYRLHTPADFACALAAMPVSWWLRLTNDYEEVAAPIRDPDETLAEISRNVVMILPGAAIGRQLLFRYSLIWRKPSG
jgi:SAM-dependent methyltransferase